jgi:prevent-host-death family protein
VAAEPVTEEYNKSMAREPRDVHEDVPASDFLTRAENLVDRVRSTRRPIVVTQEGRGTAVLVDIESYRSLLDEVELLRDLHRGLADIEAGRVVPHEEARARLLARYK